MNNGRAGDEGDQASREAIDWLVANESDVAGADHGRLAHWIKWSTRPDNRTAYADAVRMREDLRRLSRPPGISREDLLKDAADDPDVVIARNAPRRPDSGPAGYRRAPWRMIWATAAVISFLVVGTFWLVHWPWTTERTWITTAGEQRTFVLDDGSQVTLGGDSHLKVRFTDRARIVELERGAALFRVQHDTNRPFVVKSDRGTTTAVGTEFEVRRYADHVQVWVREGAVVVAPLKDIAIDDAALVSAARLAPIRLAGGQELSYDARGKATAPRTADPHLTAAWSAGRLVPLVYRNRPLAEVIQDVQPYMQRRIVVDPTLVRLEYSGIVNQEDIDAWIRDLGSIYPVEVVDCRSTENRAEVRGCTNASHIVIRSRMATLQEVQRSENR